MKPEVATRRIKTFKERFGEVHLYLAYHAAFPLALTPDLLYRMWANFQRDINGEALNIPWMAVADLLLSSLCDEVGHELYEMDTAVRNALLKELKENASFGDKRINELSDFLLAYVQQQLESHDPDMRDFAQTQRWTALAYTRPNEVAREIASTLAGLKLEDKAEWVRMASVVETFADPLAGFEPLLIYTRSIRDWVRGDTSSATNQLKKALGKERSIQCEGVNLLIPEPIASLENLKTQQESQINEVENSLEFEGINTSTERLKINSRTPNQVNNLDSERISPQSNISGRPNYSRQNLRGHSFKSQNLEYTDFRYCDIRGADFSNANLTGANFSYAIAGPQYIGVLGGTSFRNADLTDANFTNAILKNTDFRKAILTRTCWQNARNLEQARINGTYLEASEVRQLVITKDGRDRNYDYKNLRGLNLQDANLEDASFIGADLSAANLQNANLSRAKLIRAQLYKADLTEACLTGAFIEDWGISSDTQFDGVRCEYVYMRLPTKENPNPLRKPENREEVFADGEFGDFIKPILDTLDLYHNQGVDPRAIAISFKQLAENDPDAELEIVAMEKRSTDKFLLRAKVGDDANRSQLSQEYFEINNQLKSLSHNELQKLLQEKETRIRALEKMVETALQRPSFYAQTYQNQGNTMSERSDNSTYSLNQTKFGGGFAGTGGTQTGGTLYDYSSNPSLAEAAAEIQQLLQQLETTNPTTTSANKRAVVNQAIEAIENNPGLKAKVIAALNASGTEGLKTAINHPLAKNMMPFLEEV